MQPFKPRILLSDSGVEFKNKYVEFICKHHKVFPIIAPPRRPLGIIERFNQTLKRRMKTAISQGKMNHIHFDFAMNRIVKQYNTTTHSTTKYKPIVIHFTYDKQILQKVADRIQEIKTKNEKKNAVANMVRYKEGDRVRVTTLRDPSLTSAERNDAKQAFTYKKFARSFWSKRHFIIYGVLPNDYYTLEDYPNIRFHHTELQPVKNQH
jgi:transposase InsO family protein